MRSAGAAERARRARQSGVRAAEWTRTSSNFSSTCTAGRRTAPTRYIYALHVCVAGVHARAHACRAGVAPAPRRTYALYIYLRTLCMGLAGRGERAQGVAAPHQTVCAGGLRRRRGLDVVGHAKNGANAQLAVRRGGLRAYMYVYCTCTHRERSVCVCIDISLSLSLYVYTCVCVYVCVCVSPRHTVTALPEDHCHMTPASWCKPPGQFIPNKFTIITC